jgi:hypothetical protein
MVAGDEDCLPSKSSRQTASFCYERLPQLVADLVQGQVIVASGTFGKGCPSASETEEVID